MLLQERYDQAVRRIADGDHAGAEPLLREIGAELTSPATDLEWAFAAGAAYLRAECAAAGGNMDEALAKYEEAAADFGNHNDVRVQYWGIAADFSRARLLAEMGHAKEAHDALDLLTIRTMMESHPPIRTIWNQAAVLQKQLADEHGFTFGDGLDAEAEKGRVAPAPSNDDGPSYEKRESLTEKTPRIWTVSNTTLTINQFGQETRIPFEQIGKIHLEYAPTQFKLGRYTLRLSDRSGRRFDIDNIHFEGFANFEDRSMVFSLVMGILLESLTQGGHRVEITSGVSWGYYLLMLLITVIASPILLLGAIAGGFIGMGIFLVVSFFAVPTIIRWLKKNRPKRLTSDEARAFLPPILG
jgi:tetratricopeptide (TPR) repeat protein